ncbi:MAG TPA: FoF1 ATP synthase subunit gamma [Candidatus Binataceae bacterium]|nr:FoF1 ATP synthase subunit gamma [Candidatus Binataceae bacterium]
MAQEREIATRLVSLGQLGEIVAAIRAMAASQMQQALRSLDAIRKYSEMVRVALSDAASMLPGDGVVSSPTNISPSALVLFCAEHGLCGGFNEHPLRVAEQILADKRSDFLLIVVGSRGGQICRERGLQPDLVLPMATRCAGVTAAARRLANEIYRNLSERRIAGLEMIYAQHAGSELARIERQRLLPLASSLMEQRPMRTPPLINLNARRLFDDIVSEYFFAALENAAMQSFFAENSTRFRTMEAAHQNIDNKTEDLTKLARRLRQEAVTTEILDLISSTADLSLR